ncbi:lipase family protein [Rhodococcus sp. P1Y]|uniref:lipase family protein n=1 Tax=Rhodococcus sp. P1Y TaxID=1302308 RepID=UPI00129390AE|nr:lipase family protein [Rhodococcus sp. P1Y]
MTKFRGIRRIGSVVLAVALLASCAPDTPTARNAVTATTNPVARPDRSVAPTAPAQLGGSEPGSLLSAERFTTVVPRISETGAQVSRIRYVSTASDGVSRTEVTGTVFVPNGIAPEGGWRVVSYGHGNTGINFDCGPSMYDDLLNQWLPITALLLNGYMVVMSDYEGLGSGGNTIEHPFLDADTLGYNVIDAVRAARHLTPDAGSQWAAFGGSLGGLATWAAHDVEPRYGQGLDLVGAAAWVPVADVSDLPAKAAAGLLTRDQVHLYFLAIMGLKATTAPDLNLDDYMRGSIAANKDLLVLCNGPRVPEAIDVLANADKADLVPASPAAQALMESLLKQRSLDAHTAGAPLLVMYADQDELVDQAWTKRVLSEACASGGSIEWELRIGEGHGTIDASRAFSWIGARFDGQEAVGQCPSV